MCLYLGVCTLSVSVSKCQCCWISLELELQTAVKIPYMGVSSACTSPLSHLPSPMIVKFKNKRSF